MPQSLSQIYVHLVFSTKSRKPWLDDVELRSRLHAYMATILRDGVSSPAIVINSVEDHIHSLIRMSRQYSIMNVVKQCKVSTSKWLKRQQPKFASFAWQSGYGAFSVSESMLGHVESYIVNQQQHHLRLSFKDEFRELCRRHGLEIDERYAWD